ncbi:MAG: hypothetical protein RL120_02835, partial [Gammaproteobacteria bacterium]
MKTRILLALCLVLTPFGLVLAQSGDDYVAPRTEWGQPDLQGVWNFNSSTPFERPEQYGNREFLTPEEIEESRVRRAEFAARADAAEAELVTDPQAPPAGASTGGYNNFWYEQASISENTRTSRIIYPTDGQMPATVEGVAVHTANLGPDVEGDRPVLATFGGIGKDGPEDRGLSERCLIGFNAGPPLTGGGYNANLQIFQNKDHAVIMTEMVHDARIVPLVERPPLDGNIRQWSGDSRGYYDGDTLVVETRNFTKYTPSYSRYGDAYDKTLTEKFTRIGPYTVQYEWTLDDPSTFSDKITATQPMTKVAGQLYEYGCHEG